MAITNRSYVKFYRVCLKQILFLSRTSSSRTRTGLKLQGQRQGQGWGLVVRGQRQGLEYELKHSDRTFNYLLMRG